MEDQSEINQLGGIDQGYTRPQWHQMLRTRKRLARSRHERQKAAADFPVRTQRAAEDLKRLCEMRESGAVMSDEAHEAMRMLEDLIRSCYRDTFGTEMGH